MIKGVDNETGIAVFGDGFFNIDPCVTLFANAPVNAIGDGACDLASFLEGKELIAACVELFSSDGGLRSGAAEGRTVSGEELG